MTEDPFFSIIVPVYNTEKYLKECIDSVIDQTFTDFELLLVDDGSKDSSYEICTGYAEKDKRIIPIRKDNGGPSSARNLGLERSKGKFIAFLDSDDIIDKDWLQAFYKTINEYNADICYQGLEFFYDDDNIEHRDFKKSTSCIIPLDDFEQYFEDKWVLLSATVTKCIKAELIKRNKISFNCNISICEDFLFTCSALNVAEKIAISHYDGYRYRVVKGSLSRHKIDHKKFIDTFNNVTQDKVWATKTKLSITLKKFYGSYSVYPLLDHRLYKLLKKDEKHRIYSYFRKYGIVSNRKKSVPLKFLCRIKAADALFNLYYQTIARFITE